MVQNPDLEVGVHLHSHNAFELGLPNMAHPDIAETSFASDIREIRF
jgi:hypothetical protein